MSGKTSTDRPSLSSLCVNILTSFMKVMLGDAWTLHVKCYHCLAVHVFICNFNQLSGIFMYVQPVYRTRIL